MQMRCFYHVKYEADAKKAAAVAATVAAVLRARGLGHLLGRGGSDEL